VRITTYTATRRHPDEPAETHSRWLGGCMCTNVAGNTEQYTTYITTSTSMGSSVWRHAIRNSCNDDRLPHPLHNDTIIYNIHHSLHYTTLVATNISYSYYDLLHYLTPPPVTHIHRTLKYWYKDLSTPLLLTTQHPTVIKKSTPRQTDGWSCGLHMLLIHLATIYQGGPPRYATPNATQNNYHAFSSDTPSPEN
jgi:hypothetical protein